MGRFTVSSNAKQVQAKIKKKKEAIHAGIEATVKKTARDVRTTLYGYTPKAESFSAIRTRDGRSTKPITVTGGRARASFTNSPKKAGDAIYEISKYDAKIGTTVFYMNFLEDGTRGHGPTRAKFLRFATTSGVVFAKFVRGIQPHKIFARTRRMYKVIYAKRLKEATRKGLAA